MFIILGGGVELTIFCVISCFTLAIILFSQSRTALLIVLLIPAYFVSKSTHKWLKRLLVVCVGIGLLVLGVWFFQKQHSTSGRAFILQNTLEIIQQNPLWGVGLGFFEKNYNHRQYLFFKENGLQHPASYTADYMQSALCDPLEIWATMGLPGLLVFISVFVVAMVYPPDFHHRLLGIGIGIACSLSFFIKYPPLVILLWYWLASVRIPAKSGYKSLSNRIALLVCMGTVLLCCSRIPYSMGLRKLHLLSTQGWVSENHPFFQKQESAMQYDSWYWYQRSKPALQTGNEEKAIRYLEKACSLSASANLRLEWAQVYRKKGQYNQAIQLADYARYVQPNRFTPPSLLLSLYHESGQPEKALAIAREILEMPVKIPSAEVYAIRQGAEKYIQFITTQHNGNEN